MDRNAKNRLMSKKLNGKTIRSEFRLKPEGRGLGETWLELLGFGLTVGETLGEELGETEVEPSGTGVTVGDPGEVGVGVGVGWPGILLLTVIDALCLEMMPSVTLIV